jgi:hypothetical protein
VEACVGCPHHIKFLDRANFSQKRTLIAYLRTVILNSYVAARFLAGAERLTFFAEGSRSAFSAAPIRKSLDLLRGSNLSIRSSLFHSA